MAYAKRFDLYVKQGEDHTVRVRWSEDGTQEILAGWTAAMQARPTAASANTLLSLTSDPAGLSDAEYAGGIFLDEDGDLLLTIPGETSTALVVPPDLPSRATNGIVWLQLGVYDLELRDPEGTVIRLAAGRLYLSPEVTR